jgi:hypothetical protein
LKSGVTVKDKKITIPKKFQSFSMGIRIISSILLISPFIFFNITYYFWQIIILIIGIIGMIYLTIKLITINEFDRNKIRKYISTQSFLRYSLVPVMLLSTIGVLHSVILILIPIVWYIIFVPLSGEKILKPRM